MMATMTKHYQMAFGCAQIIGVIYLLMHGRLLSIVFIASTLLFSNQLYAEFSQKLDLQFRFDDRSNRDVRYQYRARYYPQFSLNDSWSAHAFAVTGDEFSSSHNTFDDGQADYFYMRRFYARHKGDYGKTEIGYIPPFKGRVSSTGLSKDGWVAGVRHVRQLGSNNQIEFVLGQLDNLDPAQALDVPEQVDYIEIEYSARMDERSSYEFSFERITQGNYLRTEYRYRLQDEAVIFAELVKRFDRSRAKVVVGLDKAFTIAGYSLESFSYYAYVSEDYGQRANLIEDFLGTGHGISTELSGDTAVPQLGWFVRYDLVETRSRLLAGIKLSL